MLRLGVNWELAKQVELGGQGPGSRAGRRGRRAGLASSSEWPRGHLGSAPGRSLKSFRPKGPASPRFLLVPEEPAVG